MRGRRGLMAVTAAGLASLAGCGFRPLYLPASGSGGAEVGAELGAIYVPVMAERSGQLMRQALQRRFEGSGLGVQKRYELITAPVIAAETLGVQTDSSITRIRFNGSADWTLRRLDPARTVMTTGTSRITDGLNIVAGQFFAVELESETVTRRVAEALADQIAQQVAVHLRRQAAPPAA